MVDKQDVIETLAGAVIFGVREHCLHRLGFAILVIIEGTEGSLADTSIGSGGTIDNLILALPGHDFHQNFVLVLQQVDVLFKVWLTSLN